MIKKHESEEFYGTTTLGEKGQVVIPAEAREALKLKKGEKLLVFGFGCEMVAFAKVTDLKKFANHLSKKLESIQDIIQKNSERE